MSQHSSNPANDPPEDPAPELESRIEGIAEAYLGEIQSGGGPDRGLWAKKHPDLAPWLERRLWTMDMVHGFALASGSESAPSSRPEDELEVPAALGRFEVLGLVGRGTFGAVYRARDAELDRIVAIKVPRAGSFATPEAEERFLREARSAARLRHPAIVTVHEIGFENELPFIVSEFIDGRTLADAIRAERLTHRAAAAIVATVADAIDYAHRSKVIHRDVKPQNILLDDAGRPHVADFGLARADEDGDTVTLEGQVIGTPAYMSPEQAVGDTNRVDARSDVYSLGIVLYELLTGERPHRGSRTSVLHQVIHSEPKPPRRWDAEIPRDLETITLKAIAKEKSRRYESARALADDLERYLSGEPILARPTGSAERLLLWSKRKPVVAGLAFAVLLLLLVVTFVSTNAYFGIRRERDATKKALDASQARLTRAQIRSGAAAPSPDGLTSGPSWFAEAFVEDQHDPATEKAHRIRLATALAQTPVVLRACFHDGPILACALSSDGRLFATASEDRTARVWVTDTGEPAGPPLLHEREAQSAAFDADGHRLLTTSGDASARVWDIASGKSLFRLTHDGRVLGAVYSPGGDRILTWSDDGTARLWSAAAGEPLLEPLRHEAPVRAASFSADGKRLATASGKRVRLWSAAQGTLAMEPIDLAEAVMLVLFNPTATRLAVAGTQRNVWLLDAATGAQVGSPMSHSRQVQSAVFTPDGSLLVVSTRGGSIFNWMADTAQPRPPRMGWAAPPTCLAASPDGDLLAQGNIGFTVWIGSLRAGAAVYPPLLHAGAVTDLRFHPDGRRLITTSSDGVARVWDLATRRSETFRYPLGGQVHVAEYDREGARIVVGNQAGRAIVLDAATGRPISAKLRHDAAVACARFSPDGRWLATCGGAEAALWQAPGFQRAGSPLRHSSAVRCLDFSPDGTRLVTVAADGKGRVWDVERREVVAVHEGHQGEATLVEIAPDGRLIVSAGVDSTVQVWESVTGRLAVPSIRLGGQAYVATFNASGTRILTCSTDTTARVWDAATGKAVGEPMRHISLVRNGCFSPDGTLVATASPHGMSRIWDTETGKPLVPQLQHGNSACIRFSPDSRFVATGTLAGAVRVWDASSGDPVTLDFHHRGRVWQVRFSPDGSHLLSASDDGTARVWDLTPDHRSAEELRDIARACSSLWIDDAGSLAPMDREELRSLWARLEASHPGGLERSCDLAAWRLERVDDCEASGNWRGAMFHLDRLLAVTPDDEALKARRARIGLRALAPALRGLFTPKPGAPAEEDGE